MKVFEQMGLVQPLKGCVGIEVEVEGENLPEIENLQWNSHHDGSLRGESFEYVTNGILKRSEVMEALEHLEEELDNSKVEDSPRCGVHIHVNVQDLEVSEVVSFITSYLCFENVLVKWCGEDRVGNLFCLRASDAYGLIHSAKELAILGDIAVTYTDRVRYGSVNLKALREHGSLEFRALRGTTDSVRIATWVGMLLSLRDYSVGKKPDQIIQNFSVMGAQDFFNLVLGNYRDDLNPDLYDLVEGMRNAQEVAFCRNWGVAA